MGIDFMPCDYPKATSLRKSEPFTHVLIDVSFWDKTRRRKPGSLRAQERYVRTDLSCGRSFCRLCFGLSNSKSKSKQTSPFYLVPDATALIQCVELLEESTFENIMKHLFIFQSIYQEALRIAPTREGGRLKNFFRDDKRMVSTCEVHFFADQHHAATFVEPHITSSMGDNDNAVLVQLESFTKRYERAIVNSLQWLSDHFSAVDDNDMIVFMSNDASLCSTIQETVGSRVQTCSCLQFIDAHIKSLDTRLFLQDIAVNVQEAIEAWQHKCQSEGTSSSGEYSPYLTPSQIEAKIQNKDVLMGKLDVSSHNPMEAYVKLERPFVTKEMPIEKIFVYGREMMNRAVHGDKVVLELLPPSEWLTPASDRLLVHYATTEDTTVDSGSQKRVLTESDKIMEAKQPTGRIVGIYKRSTRTYVATVLSNTVAQGDDFAIAIPMDIRIPKVRIRSQRMDTLLDQRVKIVIDHWPIDSMYPQGHYLGVLGPSGSLATELSALLVQNEIEEAPFCEAALACLPDDCGIDIGKYKVMECSTKKRPTHIELLDWNVPLVEVAKRRDIRNSHRVFSVDPPGCQDIDDAMSVRRLANGNLEVGVHIADVSYFVTHESALDYEARSRATTVYLVGQRLDMLPSVLSADLCSLHANVDRLAMSVFWELDPETFEILPEKTWYGRTIIRSCASMTYEQAHRLIQGVKAGIQTNKKEALIGVAGGPVPSQLEEPLRDDLRLLTDVSRKLARQRGDSGAIDLSKKEEVRFSLSVSELGQEGVELMVKESLEIHNTIAELMILANGSVAKKIYEAFPSHALLRCHPPPSGHRFNQLIKLAHVKDIAIDASSNYGLQKSLIEAEKSGKLDAKSMALLKSLAVRVMSEAEYICSGDRLAPEDHQGFGDKNITPNFAHYGLGLSFYTHFTSPIRRYADIIVHRQLLQALESVVTDTRAKNLAPTATRHVSSQPLPQLPASSVMSVLDNDLDDKDFLDDLISSVDSQLQVTTALEQSTQIKSEDFEVGKMKIQEEKEVFPSHELVSLSIHLNRKNRNAKNASRDCDDLFLALYFSTHTIKAHAIITTLKQNGFIVYVPKYDLRAPVYIRDRDGNVQMDPLLLGVRLVDSKPPTGAFSNAAENIRLIPGAEITLDHECETLSVQVPSKDPCIFKMLDEIEVQISCDLSYASVRVPQVQLLMLGRVKSIKNNRDLLLRQQEMQSSLPELQRVVANHQVEIDQIEEDFKDYHTQMSTSNTGVSSSAFDSTMNLATLTPKKTRTMYELLEDIVYEKNTGKSGNGFDFSRINARVKKLVKKKTVQFNKRGPGRFIYGNYQPPINQKYNRTLESYLGNRSAELEEEMSIERYHHHAAGSSTNMSQNELKRTEKEAMTRIQKLTAEKRHDRINRRNKANK
jgi:DIS3-like exonuclease 1